MKNKKLFEYKTLNDNYAKYIIYANPGSKKLICKNVSTETSDIKIYKINNIFEKNNYSFIKSPTCKRYFKNVILKQLKTKYIKQMKKRIIVGVTVVSALFSSIKLFNANTLNDSKISNHSNFSSLTPNLSNDLINNSRLNTEKLEPLNEIEQYHGYSFKDIEEYDYLQEEIDFNNETSHRLSNVEVTKNKSFMHAPLIDDPTSYQYRFLFGDESDVVEDEKGYYKLDDRYCVAMGSYFGPIGTQYDVYLERELPDGTKAITILKVVKGESKDDKDTINGFEHNVDSSIIEFLVNENNNYLQQHKVPAADGNIYIHSGNFNNFEPFNGNIVEIKIVPDYSNILETNSNFIPEAIKNQNKFILNNEPFSNISKEYSAKVVKNNIPSIK